MTRLTEGLLAIEAKREFEDSTVDTGYSTGEEDKDRGSFSYWGNSPESNSEPFLQPSCTIVQT
jgi:hypothetical protein